MKTIVLITTLSLINTFGSTISMASYNTFLIPTNKHASSTTPQIITEIKKSNIDLICLQELFVPSSALEFEAAVSSSYPYSFHEANTLSNLKTSRVPCSSDEEKLLESQCITTLCASLFEVDPYEFIACASLSCPNDIFPLIDTECQACLFFARSAFADPSGTIKKSFQDSLGICTNLIPFSPALSGGNMVLSKYPILNKWIYRFHSSISHQNILITEIDVSFMTGHGAAGDTIIFACTHLVATDGNGAYFPTSQMEVNLGIKSYEELNAWQTNFILDRIKMLSVKHENNVIGTVIAGDLNVGYTVFPQNFNMWQYSGFRPVGELVSSSKKIGCTYCGDADGNDLKNKLAIKACVETECKVKNVDIDHILIDIYTTNLQKIEPMSYERIFTNEFNIDGEELPLSDHWGVALWAHVNTIY